MAPRNPALAKFGRSWLKPLTLVLLLLPAIWLGAHWAGILLEFYGGGAGPLRPLLTSDWTIDPIKTTHHFLGETAIRILLVSLCVRPFRELSGWAPIMTIRRRVGLAAFFYALAHFLAYFGMDLFFSLAKLWEDVALRLYITLGMAALILLIPLAVTSTNGMIKRLGALRWRRLHQLVYVIAALAVAHHFFAVKGVQFGPLIHGGILALLLGYRVYSWRRKKQRRSRMEPAPAPTGANSSS